MSNLHSRTTNVPSGLIQREISFEHDKILKWFRFPQSFSLGECVVDSFHMQNIFLKLAETAGSQNNSCRICLDLSSGCPFYLGRPFVSKDHLHPISFPKYYQLQRILFISRNRVELFFPA